MDTKEYLKYEKFIRKLEKKMEGKIITVRSIIFILMEWEQFKKQESSDGL